MRAMEATATRPLQPPNPVEYWKKVVKRQPPAKRRRWLLMPEAHAALGADVCKDAIDRIDYDAAKVSREVCSASWIAAWVLEGIRRPRPEPDRVYGVNLILSRCETRICGVGGAQERGREDTGFSMTPTRRWTPPQCVDEEDLADMMQRGESWPASPSAAAIRAIEYAGGRKPTKRAMRRGRVFVWITPSE